jgi:hypothetical protein
VGVTHARRGNRTGAARLLTRAADRIEPYAAAPPHGVAVARLTDWARTTAGRLARAGGEPAGDTLAPRLTGR